MLEDSIVIRLGGESGEGIVTIGDLLARLAGASGYWVYTLRSFPAEILGGHVMFQLRIGMETVRSVGDRIDALVALNQDGYDRHVDLLSADGIIIYNSDAATISPDETRRTLAVPLDKIASDIGVGSRAGKNMIAFGVIGRLLGFPRDIAESVVIRRLGKRKDLLEANLLGLRTGYEWAADNLPVVDDLRLPPTEPEGACKRMLVTGNQAIALGALAAGLKFYSGYPITPATDIMEFLAGELPRLGGTLIQAEDEIAALAMCIGASFSGARAMTATSGPGVALMTELLGLASMTEVPVVVVDVQRSGPSTGMPTKTAQSDLWMAVHGASDEGPRIVLAPTSVEDCFYQMINAFNMADRYQVPVIVLSEQALATRIETVPAWPLDKLTRLERVTPPPAQEGDEPYKRYKITENGISPMAIPGDPMHYYTAEGLEHTEFGAPSYDPENRRAMMEKRWRKMETAYQEYRTWPMMFRRFGAEKPDLGIICWGSVQGPVREALKRQLHKGRRVAAFVPKVLSPLPRDEIREFADSCKAILIPELNMRGQFADLLKSELGIDGYRLNKYEGIPFYTFEIEEQIDRIYEELGLPEYEMEQEGAC